MRKLLTILLASALGASAGTATFDEITQAIRQNDLNKLQQLVGSREAANAANGLHVTPLHYSALYGSPEAMQVLLKAGADPNARNQAQVTPLVYAAWSKERTRLLVEHGADVNAVTNQGLTPLLVAASAHENLDTLRYLLDKGADVGARNANGEDALMRASRNGDVEMVKLLLERGADAKRADRAGFTALQHATTHPEAARVRMLLEAGSDANAFNTFAGIVKNGPIALTHMTTLMTAAPYSDQETISRLLKAGAHVNDVDSRKMTPLMLSIATDHAQPATVRQLLAAGADVQAKDVYGDTALDWAHKHGNPEITSMLVEAGARGHMPPELVLPNNAENRVSAGDSMGRALTLFGKSDFFRAGGGCAGCHHQPMYARAYAAARVATSSADPSLRRAFLDAQMAERPRSAGILPFLTSFGGDVDTVLGLTSANVDLDEAPSEMTDMMVHFLAVRQDPSGAWVHLGIARAPISDSTITRTAQAMVALEHYSWPAREAEFRARIERGKQWLQKAKPETTYEHADRILGLRAAGVTAIELRADGERLLQLQREDGGWAQTPYLQTDAYATGLVLDTLFRTGLLKASDAAYGRGVAYLLRTQSPDGSWHVRSRAPKFQPYFQSGFPFDHDQWISSIGSSWAVMGLSHAVGASPGTVAMR